MNVQEAQRSVPAGQEMAVVSWLRQNRIPIQHIEAGTGFADLQPLKPLLSDAKVIGLGETTHGTREFFQLKHRLIEFLVTEMNFTAFAIESGYAACQPINDYVLYGKGDRASVLTGQWYVLWDTEEMAALIDWMRAYNQTVSDEKKVSFHGVDINHNNFGRQAILDYLSKVAPDMLAAAESLLEALGREDAKWPTLIDDDAETTMEQLLPRLQVFIDDLMANKNALVARSSLLEYDQIVRYAQILRQWVFTNVTNLLPPSRAKSDQRSVSMADNLIYLVDQAAPEAKFIIWEHNDHIGVENADNPNLGCILREKYGQAYFAFGFEFNQGSFHTRTFLPPHFPADLKEVTLPAAPEGSLAWYLSQTGADVLIVNLRAPATDPVVQQWFHMPQIAHNVRWAYDETLAYYEEWNITKRFDGLIFVDRTTAAHPTANALKTIAARDGA